MTTVASHHQLEKTCKPWEHGPGYVYIGRGSKWGNPYSHMVGTKAQYHAATRGEAIRQYALYLHQHPELLGAIKQELAGKTLVCFCKPAACHGDILAALADEP